MTPEEFYDNIIIKYRRETNDFKLIFKGFHTIIKDVNPNSFIEAFNKYQKQFNSCSLRVWIKSISSSFDTFMDLKEGIKYSDRKINDLVKKEYPHAIEWAKGTHPNRLGKVHTVKYPEK